MAVKRTSCIIKAARKLQIKSDSSANHSGPTKGLTPIPLLVVGSICEVEFFLVTWFSTDFFCLFHPCGFDSFKKGRVAPFRTQENSPMSRLGVEFLSCWRAISLTLELSSRPSY